MVSKVEKYFIDLADNNSRIDLLRGQWVFDKQIIKRALNNVSNLFPHYSSHDVSHSEIILSRISSVLGEGISLLSGTDLWLILEAAYLHDVGMIATAKQRNKDLQSEEFKRFVKDCSNNDNGFGKACSQLKEIGSEINVFDLEQKYRHLLIVYSEFIRQKHADRSKDVVLNPVKTATAESPRNSLLPNRLWHLIGQICKAHGQDRSFVMNLPYQENGIGEDICHPRFVASILRLGDLLDIDSDRFCPSINSMIDPIPEVSKKHRKKHLGIQHFLVTSDIVEVEGVYDDVEVYLEAESWFNWLREELTFYSLRWEKIDPNPSIGSLPSIGKIEARLENQVVLEPGARPQFELDREKVLDLVKGANIYEGPEDALRELIQNSIDATLLRYSYECQSRGKEKPKSPDELRDHLSNYPIEVSINKSKNFEDKAIWNVSIEDNGIGLREKDIKYMLTLGSSKKNNYRKILQEWLPGWAQPSGAFGIGFHSIFKYAKVVIMETRHPESKNSYQIKFESIRIGKEPKVIVKRLEDGNLFPRTPGTKVEFELELDKIPSFVSVGHDEVYDELLGYDFMKDKELKYKSLKLNLKAKSIAKNSLCKFRLDSDQILESRSDSEGILFDEKTGLEISLLGATLGTGIPRVNFKGAKVQSAFRLPLLSVYCNILEGNAKDYVELSRNKLTREGNKILSRNLEKSLNENIKEWLKVCESKELVSLYMHLYTEQESSDDWLNVSFSLAGQSFTVGKILEYDQIELILGDINNGKEVVDEVSGKLILENVLKRSGPKSAIVDLLAKYFNPIKIKTKEGKIVYVLGKDDQSVKILPNAIGLMIKNNSRIGLVGSRFSIPCAEKYKELLLPTDYKGWGVWPNTFVDDLMPSPVLKEKNGFSVKNIEEYISWLTLKKNVSKESIKDSLVQFFKDVYKVESFKKLHIKNFDIDNVIYRINNF